MKAKWVFSGIVAFTLGLFLNLAYASHPLITDDTGTQGKGKLLIEFNSELGFDKETEDGLVTKVKGGELSATFSYGITDSIDIVLGLPYRWEKTKVDGSTVSNVKGLTDITLEVKGRFFEGDGFSLAMKPAISLPTGDEKEGLGNGKVSYGLTLIATKEVSPWAFHLNIGYGRNEYKLSEDKEALRRDIWHASIATEVELIKALKLVGNIGLETNQNKGDNVHPAFLLGGLIYSISENVSLDLGIKGGLNRPETDLTILAGIAIRW